jgi:microcystin-dependent protein
VGSYYTSEDPEDPGTIFGGTWIRVNGKVLVGVDEADPDFDTVNETGGEKEHQLTVAEMPAHNHGGATVAGGVHAHNIQRTIASGGTAGAGLDFTSGRYTIAGGYVENSTSHTHGISSQGDDGAHNNLQPYITCYMWKRTA